MRGTAVQGQLESAVGGRGGRVGGERLDFNRRELICT